MYQTSRESPGRTPVHPSPSLQQAFLLQPPLNILPNEQRPGAPLHHGSRKCMVTTPLLHLLRIYPGKCSHITRCDKGLEPRFSPVLSNRSQQLTRQSTQPLQAPPASAAQSAPHATLELLRGNHVIGDAAFRAWATYCEYHHMPVLQGSLFALLVPTGSGIQQVLHPTPNFLIIPHRNNLLRFLPGFSINTADFTHDCWSKNVLGMPSSNVTTFVSGRVCLRSSIVAGWQVKKSKLLYTSPSPRDGLLSRMPSSA